VKGAGQERGGEDKCEDTEVGAHGELLRECLGVE